MGVREKRCRGDMQGDRQIGRYKERETERSMKKENIYIRENN